MKKIIMTIGGVAFMSIMALAQNIDSTRNQNGATDFRDNPVQDSAMTQPANPQPIEGTPRTQDRTNSPAIQTVPQQQNEPRMQTDPQQQPVESPLQTQPQADPTSPTQQVDPSSPTQQTPQLNQPAQPTQQQPTISPSPATPTGGGTPPR